MNEDSGSRMPRNDGADTDKRSQGSLRGYFNRMLRPRNGETVRGALEELIEEHPDAEAPINEEERTLFANILNLRARTVADVMVPRADIVGIELTAGREELLEIIREEAHSRVPVYQKTLDDSMGMVHIKDLLLSEDQEGGFNLKSLIRSVLFVAPSMHVLELLLEMRVKRTHMALVVDEFGGVDGLLTIEDLVEEIVGEIEDEHDQEEVPALKQRDDGTWDADARVEVGSFEESYGAFLSDEERAEINTMGGLVFSLAGRVPIRGELVRHPAGLEIEVLDADPRRIRRLRVRPLPDEDDSQDEG